MAGPDIRFDDGAAYERYMGAWSRLAGDVFLDWLAPARGLRWLDVGCGNGAFTAKIVERCAPAAVHGIDPSPEQLAHARTRSDVGSAAFALGDAMALPFGDDAFDAAVMPLVLFFVPRPAAGVAEMARVVRPGGTVSAYAWDMYGGGFPYAPVGAALRETGVDVPGPPSPEASRVEAMEALWRDAGLVDVQTRAITVARAFASFDDYWATARLGPAFGRLLGAIPDGEVAGVRAALRERLPAADAEGRIVISATANAVRGRVAG
ncbi:class I SAM-dependent methyltransferase [Roseisolibacter sp. H3M3-2]|uniref:class I SAM-dependent methyltransferase n=1 Tax=Roseisolibacter sp. H3M3-2 TaxID=3031323 RepID=UPI0023DA2D2F|nr:class I SAM-dependent methyltransferase [Roseisolibacter sp. H3M3-2]MDF1502379.1 methyltransferase domain-containing protein [Roseisolibacter sp. H3M3-2]